MSSDDIKDDRRYTTDHEWAKSDGSNVLIGISAYAVDQLGDVTLVNIDVAEGDDIEAGKPFGTVESVKTLADLYAPISGKIAKVNGALEEAPELVNDDCYGEGWLIAVVPANASAVDELMDHTAYQKLLEDAD